MDKLVREIAIDIEKAGGRTFKVGGCLRDQLLNLTPKDIDLEVYGIPPNDLVALLQHHDNVKLVGESFGIYKLGNLDIAIPRKEKSIGRSHKSLEIDVDPWLEPRRACLRRDFTYNAMLQDVLTEEILDFYGGRNDLRYGIVRHIDDETFVEDPLRMLRAAKFASRFGHIIAHKTVILIRENREYVKNLPAERIFSEVSDILLNSRKPSYGFKVLDYLKLLEILFPEIWALKGVEQNPAYHPEGNVFNHTMGVIDYYPIEKRTLTEQLAYLFHDVGKLFGKERHDLNSVKIVNDIFPERLTNNTDIIKDVTNIIKNHMAMYGGSVSKARVRRLASKIDLPTIIRMGMADNLSRPLSPDEIEERRQHLQKFLTIYDEVQNEVKPIMRGQDIIDNFPSVKPGVQFGNILKEVYEKQLDGEFSTHEEGLVVLEAVIGER